MRACASAACGPEAKFWRYDLNPAAVPAAKASAQAFSSACLLACSLCAACCDDCSCSGFWLQPESRTAPATIPTVTILRGALHLEQQKRCTVASPFARGKAIAHLGTAGECLRSRDRNANLQHPHTSPRARTSESGHYHIIAPIAVKPVLQALNHVAWQRDQ